MGAGVALLFLYQQPREAVQGEQEKRAAERLLRNIQRNEVGNKITIFARVLSMFWVVYGHDYMVRLRLISNIADL